MKKQILIIGKIPPPIGGVTIHVQRLLRYLLENDLDYYFYDLKKFSIFEFISLLFKYKFAHLHTSSPYLRFIFALVCLFTSTKSIITIHGNINRYNYIKNFLEKICICLVKYPIVLNKYSYDFALKLNLNTKLLSAYLPPIEKEELNDNLKKELTLLKQEYKYLIATNAYAMSFDKNGCEIYGIDFLINFFQNKKEYALIISDPSGNYHEKYSGQLCEMENIKIINYSHPFFRVLEYADIFIRNTSTDGDSLSIHEALDLNVTVIATNVVDRPEGVLLMNRDNKKDLEKILSKQEKNNIQPRKNNLDLISFYTDILQ